MKTSVLRLCVSGMALSVMGGLAACESDPSSGHGPDLQLDGSFSPFDGGSTGFDAGDPMDADADASADAADAADAADEADASDGAVDVSYSGMVGTVGGTLYEDRCPAGQLVIGLEGGAAGGFYSGVLTKARTLCGTPKLPTDGETVISIDPGVVVPADVANARGTEVAVSAVTQVSCPANQVVVGIRGNTRLVNFPPVRDVAAYVQIVCAPLSYSNLTVTIGAAALVAGGAGSTAGTPVGPFDCGPNTVAAGMRINAGQITDGVAVRCEPVVILP